jgi:hypothetical protein
VQDVPWFGLAALAAMFLLPFLPGWLLEGPRTVRHWPRRHVCGECGAPWTDGHTCEVEAPAPVPAPAAARVRPRLRGELRRIRPPKPGPRQLTAPKRALSRPTRR